MKIIYKLIALISIVLMCSCSQNDNAQLKVGTMLGAETELAVIAKDIAKAKYNLDVKIVEFNDFSFPNAALEDGSIDVNIFQHKPYLDEAMQAKGYEFEIIGKTFIYPMGIYSNKLTAVDDIKPFSKVAIPNDPSNSARALLLLQEQKLIKLRILDSYKYCLTDIIDNPLKLKIIEIEAAQLTRALGDVDISIIPTVYASAAGLNPAKDSLCLESKDSPYANLIVAKRNNPDKRLKQFVASFQTQAVINKAKELFNMQAIAAWN